MSAFTKPGTPPVVFPNPEALYVADLRTLTSAPPRPFFPNAADAISTSFPTGSLTAGKTAVQVALEAGGAGYPVTERCQMRFTAHAHQDARTSVLDLASLLQALVSTRRPDKVLAARLLGGRSNVITDPATKNLMVWFLAEVALEAELLTP